MKAIFIRALERADKSAMIKAAARGEPSTAGHVFAHEPGRFLAIPGAPFGYWVGDSVLRAFVEHPHFESIGQAARQGLSTSDDFRFVRLSNEPRSASSSSGRWRDFAKGGPYAKFFADLTLRVAWGSSEDELVAFGEIKGNGPRARQSSEFYLRPGLTWSRRSQKGLSLRALPRGCTFGDKGPSAFVDTDDPRHLFSMLAITNSRAFMALVELQMTFGSFQVGTLRQTPVPDLTSADIGALAALARRAWSLKRSLDTRTETSHAFVLPALLQVPGDTLGSRAAAWASRVRAAEDELAEIQAEIDDRCFALYGINDEDRRSITDGFGGSTADTDEDAADAAGADDEEEAEAYTADSATLVAELVSWAVGVAFGRFDVRLATGARELPGEPEPFDPLPVCSPGMLTGADGLPLDIPPAGYPLTFPADGVLVDDPGHRLDLARAVRDVFETVFGSRADAIWQEAGDLLDPKGHDVSAWLRSGFFEHHLKRHSKSRRKAPIVWQLGSGPSGIFAYAHRLTRDSLFAIANEIAAPRLATEERRLASLREGAGDSPSARDRVAIDAADTAASEARTVLAEIRRVAPLWEPDLDDGIVLVSAPLWRLVPHKAWQKELKGRWDELVAGKYDWAHLAMHLWPERVVPKSASDRSLAIAHGLEDAFWAEGADGKWARRSRPTRSIDDIITGLDKPAVKAALADLLGAPPPTGGTGRGRGRN